MANPDETNGICQISEKERKIINRKQSKEQPTAIMVYDSEPMIKDAVHTAVGCFAVCFAGRGIAGRN